VHWAKNHAEKTAGRPPRPNAFAALAMVAVGAVASLTPTPALAAPPQIPALKWEKRSDWVDLKTDVKPAAVGDGKADDIAAIQKALDGVRDGSVLYLPPGAYRITAPLSLKNPKGARWLGGLIIGCGRDTRLVWDGPAGAAMFVLNGVAYSRFVGFELDGRGKAGVGFHYAATLGFQTEVTHRHLAFRGFTDAAVLEKHPLDGQALAETTFENCLFEECGRGAAFLQFNDYDYTFDGCEFRRCEVAIDCARGNFYARNCHFEGSTVVDVRDWSEHGSSIRRCTSAGSNAFVWRSSTVAPLSIQDCHVDGWKSTKGAVVLSRPPLLLFDCLFTNPPQEAGAGTAPVRVHSDGQRVIVSGNEAQGAPGLVQAGGRPLLLDVPAGERKGVTRSASQSFLREEARVPKRVFDARRDFGAKGDGAADDTAAVQKAIDAAASASGDAIAYLPSGTYVIKDTLRITGRDFFVGGSGWGTKLSWKGSAGGAMVEVREPRNVTLEDVMIGSHDIGPMDNGADVHQSGSAEATHMTYDGVYAYGMYQKQPFKKGMQFTGLGPKDVVVMPHVQGNLRFVDCGRATVLTNCSYEGSVVVEGKGKGRDGLLGFQTRLATVVSYGLYLRDNHSIVMSDFYVEQADNGYLFEGDADAPPGRATIQGAKFHSFASDDPKKNNILDIRGYRGEIFIGPYQFYQEPKAMRIRQEGGGPLKLFLLGCSWYGARPDVKMGPAGKLAVVGNESYSTPKGGEPVADAAIFGDSAAKADLAAVSRALDDLRRLGELDMGLNHPLTGR
jgi:Pectate lyase superfamily protein